VPADVSYRSEKLGGKLLSSTTFSVRLRFAPTFS